MSSISSSKRLRAVMVALAITFAANYAISYAARSGSNVPGTTPKPRTLQTDNRSGSNVPGTTPKPAAE